MSHKFSRFGAKAYGAAAVGLLALFVPQALSAQSAPAATAQNTAAPTSASSGTLFIASDSTAANYPTARYPQSGWGQFMGCALDEPAVVNRAIGGRSTRTFIEEGRWNQLIANLTPGDTVLLQFGHNDASQSKPERFAAPATSYRQNLISFVADVRAAGATPVLLTPVGRRSFDGDLAKADFPEYSAVVKAVAQQFDVALIDLETVSLALFQATGGEESKQFFLHHAAGEVEAFPDGVTDDTHFSELGARRIADLVAGLLQQADLPISSHIREERDNLTRSQPLGSHTCH